MKALCWNGNGNLCVQSVEEPAIANPYDAIIKGFDALSAKR
jgi:hypothetical protein